MSFLDIEKRLKKGNKILFNEKEDLISELLDYINKQNRKTLILWVLDCANVTLKDLERRFTNDSRPRLALEKADKWSKGEIKMSEAKKAILDCHSMAKETSDKEFIALLHAIGQAASTVHVAKHAKGLVFYELTAYIHRYTIESCHDEITKKIDYYIDRLKYWSIESNNINLKWANFIKD